MNNTTIALVFAFMLIALAIARFSPSSDPSKAKVDTTTHASFQENWEAVNKLRNEAYKLGREAGINACFNLEIRQFRTGRPYSTQEARAWADSVAGMKGAE